MQYLGAISKTTEWSFPRQAIQHHSNPSLCPRPWYWRNWSWRVPWTTPSRTNTKRRCPFHHRGLECERDRKSRDTQNKRPRHFGLGVQNEAGQRLTVLSRKQAGHSKHHFPTTQEITLHMNTTKWSILKSDWLCSLQLKTEKLYANKTWSWLGLISSAPYRKIQAQIEEK